MARQIPSTTALLCFEASARHLSMTDAAGELNLTQSAVSRQIKNLEDFVGRPLFERIKQRLALTSTGEKYLKDIRPLLQQLEEVTLQIRDAAFSLRVAAEPAVTSRWLIPRLNDFKQQHTQIQIDMQTDTDPLGNIDDFDVGIVYGQGHWPGFTSQRFFSEELMAVCAPGVLDNDKPLAKYEEIVDYPLLHHSDRYSSTDMWLSHCKFNSSDYPGQRFDHFSLLVDAAIQGMGITVVPSYFVLEELASGKLIEACEQRLLSGNHYFLVVPEAKRYSKNIQAFLDWVAEQL